MSVEQTFEATSSNLALIAHEGPRVDTPRDSFSASAMGLGTQILPLGSDAEGIGGSTNAQNSAEVPPRTEPMRESGKMVAAVGSSDPSARSLENEPTPTTGLTVSVYEVSEHAQKNAELMRMVKSWGDGLSEGPQGREEPPKGLGGAPRKLDLMDPTILHK